VNRLPWVTTRPGWRWRRGGWTVTRQHAQRPRFLVYSGGFLYDEAASSAEGKVLADQAIALGAPESGYTLPEGARVQREREEQRERDAQAWLRYLAET
jgi:hypothetical protein